MLRKRLYLTIGVCLAAAAAHGQEPAERLYVTVSPLFAPGPSSVIMFDVGSEGGLAQGGSYDTGGVGRGFSSPEPMAIDAGSRFLFVANNISSDVSVLAIGARGALSPVATSPLSLPFPAYAMATHPSLPRLYVPDSDGSLLVYGIESTGALNLLQTVDAGRLPRAVVVSRAGTSLYVVGGFFGQSVVRAYHVAANGTLAELAASPFPVADSRLMELATTSDGRWLYAHDLDLGVFAFAIDDTGGLSPVAGSPFPVGAFSGNIALTPDDRFLYANAPYEAGIHGFAVTPNGSLEPTPESPYGGDYVAAALLPSIAGPRLYFVGRDTRRITTFGSDMQGALSPLGPPLDVIDGDGRSPVSGLLIDLVLEVRIDIEPGNRPNRVNPRSSAVLPVAILGAPGFDVTKIDLSSLRFAPAGATTVQRGRIEDVNGDGTPDLVVRFRTDDTGIVCGESSADLTGATVDGGRFHGRDAIVTLGCR